MSKFVMDSAGVNEKGNLTLGGVDHCKQYKNSIDKFYGGKGKVLYASKALSSVFMYKTVKECGLGVDVVSGGELYTALKAGTNPEDICFHGNNKTAEELKMAVENGVGRIIVDTFIRIFLVTGLLLIIGKNFFFLTVLQASRARTLR